MNDGCEQKAVRPWTRILGIDPGFRVTGYGIIESNGQESRHIANGVVKADKAATAAARLQIIFTEIEALIARYHPDELGIERVFLHRNADSALKLGQARAAAICASFAAQVAVYEYAAREVKQAVVGKGSAEKRQVEHMVRILLNLDEPVTGDAADALGIALCHAHTRSSSARLQEAMA
jgi:crossover junction endodeoxyribonuclease RuvC